MISMTAMGGSEGALRKPIVRSDTPRPPIRPSATPPLRMPIRTAPRTSANWIQNIAMVNLPASDKFDRTIGPCRFLPR